MIEGNWYDGLMGTFSFSAQKQQLNGFHHGP